MKQRHVFLFFYMVLTGAACLVLSDSARSVEEVTLISLALTCLLGVQLLLTLAGKLPWLGLLLQAAAFAAALYFDAGMYPFCGLLLAVICKRASLTAAVIALFSLILEPGAQAVLVMVLTAVPVYFVDYLVERLSFMEEQFELNREENSRLRRQLSGWHKMSRYAEHAARLSERNRLAAHIHDQVGHGISGSIMLLEGARALMPKDPERAGAAVAAAAENLRAAVDDIRASLRQERSAPGEAGLTQIAAQLAAFQTQNPRFNTELLTEGELSGVSPQVWACIGENLTDTLTNLLKHSSADLFQVSVAMKNKLVTASFRDNGQVKAFVPGMGLSAMEERCALCRGNCFFSAGPEGFNTVMTFTHSAGGML